MGSFLIFPHLIANFLGTTVYTANTHVGSGYDPSAAYGGAYGATYYSNSGYDNVSSAAMQLAALELNRPRKPVVLRKANASYDATGSQ